MNTILEYLKTGPDNLAQFEYRDWDDAMTDRVMNVIRNSVPDGRLVNEVMSGVNMSSSSRPSSSSQASSSNQIFQEASNTKVGTQPEPVKDQGIVRPEAPETSSSLDDLYADL
jgi:hypothetical protein